MQNILEGYILSPHSKNEDFTLEHLYDKEKLKKDGFSFFKKNADELIPFYIRSMNNFDGLSLYKVCLWRDMEQESKPLLFKFIERIYFSNWNEHFKKHIFKFNFLRTVVKKIDSQNEIIFSYKYEWCDKIIRFDLKNDYSYVKYFHINKRLLVFEDNEGHKKVEMFDESSNKKHIFYWNNDNKENEFYKIQKIKENSDNIPEFYLSSFGNFLLPKNAKEIKYKTEDV
ncbi:hypothetical protein EZS27_010880 [termite gut metagenome]|uniref:Uncharacterized protein n=1 Tax=termite gut metagenome TaxID=433724 RepID=A0A5J4S7E6_9ZZZZ